jgi:hypothetical protein
VGAGSGAFQVEWLRERTIAEGAHDTHSLPLETAAELGLAGLVALGLLVAGVLAGLAGTVAGLASLVSYPALLAVGLPPGRQRDQHGRAGVHRDRGGRLLAARAVRAGAPPAGLGLVGRGLGACGAALLLTTPATAFEVVVPGWSGAPPWPCWPPRWPRPWSGSTRSRP